MGWHRLACNGGWNVLDTTHCSGAQLLLRGLQSAAGVLLVRGRLVHRVAGGCFSAIPKSVHTAALPCSCCMTTCTAGVRRAHPGGLQPGRGGGGAGGRVGRADGGGGAGGAAGHVRQRRRTAAGGGGGDALGERPVGQVRAGQVCDCYLNLGRLGGVGRGRRGCRVGGANCEGGPEKPCT